ncbi:MAG: Rne/Rng family ribonuclease [Simkaniaceae bacterium]|nr:Rne/Rng family ribonuclease [Simkaniaceae bacterium]
MKEILINVTSREKRCAVLKHGKLHDLVVERKSSRQLSRNIYLGRVTNILHNIQSAFIDINEGENGFIHISDIVENTKKFQEMFEMEFDWDCDISAVKPKQVKDADISKFLEIGHPVLVQVVKEPIGSKGARLTSNITISGRYLVLLPNISRRGVSRKVANSRERERLKKIVHAFEMPRDMGLICRTAATDVSQEELTVEADKLIGTWNDIREKFHKHENPVCLYKESDLIKKAIIKAVDKKYSRILIDDHKTFQYAKTLYDTYKGEEPVKVEQYRDTTPMFDRFMVESEIERCLRRKVWLPGGGYLFFDKTEAMCTIDVNSGKGASAPENIGVEETLVRINLEAADEIARQLRIRNTGGLIICDFIDMRTAKNRRRVLEKLRDAMQQDGAKCTILGMSEFGLVEMTRQRTRESLIHTLFTDCPYCGGNGMVKRHESVAIEIERALKRLIRKNRETDLRLTTHPELDAFLKGSYKPLFTKLTKRAQGTIEFAVNDELHINTFTFHSLIDGSELEA